MRALHEYFLSGLALAPDRDAWRVGDRSVTYRQAHEAAQAVADAVLHATQTPPAAVGVLANKSSAAYVGVLAALYTGAAVVPLNAEFPATRLRHAIDAAGVGAVITDAAGQSVLDLALPVDLPMAVVRVDPDDLCSPAVARATGHDRRRHVELDAVAGTDETAYVMFTSGSTGRPKGVPITHANATAYFDLMNARYDFTADDVFSQTFDLGFDCAMFDLFSAWNVGACVTPLPQTAFRDLPAAIAERGITVWYSAPSAIGFARRSGRLTAGSLPGLRCSLFAGEAFRDDDARAWATAAPNSFVENLYGPTELTITVAGHRWSPVSPPEHRVNGIVSIGPVHADHHVLLLGPDGHPTDEHTGEMCVSGPQATIGYLDPRDDEHRFLWHGGRRYYRTGDRVRRLDDGITYAYLGRIDDQVQLHGERVELPEIDHALRSHPGVTGAATVLAGDELVVYYTGEPATPRVLARCLRQIVPASVVPKHYHHLTELPTNSNGKIDRPALRSRATGASGRLLTSFLDEPADRCPDAVAVRDASGAWTYSELRAQSRAVARWLDVHDIRRGDRLLVQLPNVREVVAILYACASRGVAFVPLNPDVRPFVIQSVVNDCTPVAAVVTETSRVAVTDLVPTTTTVDDMWAELPPCSDGGEAAHSEDVGTLIYTSGSTAAPKGVVCPQERMAFAANAIASQLGYRADDVVYCRTPLSFDYGLFQIFLAGIAGAELVLAAGPDLTLLHEIRHYRATVVPAVPSLSIMLTRLAARDHEPTALRLVTNTGAALSQSTIDDLRALFPGVQVARMYGITECKRVTIMPPDLEFERPDSVGRPLPGTSIAILDDDGNEVLPGVEGQIVVDGPNVMAGYWRSPGLTARAYRIDHLTGRRRLFTGDYGRVDDEGYLYFSGRRDDTFKRRGVRMSTVEIEAATTDIVGVTAAVALAPADGRDLTLFVVGTTGVEQVRAELARRLEPAKLPPVVHQLDELPVTLNGKPDRNRLAAALVGPTRTAQVAPV